VLVEAAAKDVMRKLDVSATCRSDALSKAHRFWQLYNDVVSSGNFFSSAAKDRARAALSMSESILGIRVSAAQVDRAILVLEKNKKTNEFCKAYDLYKAGRQYLLHGKAVVSRNASDVIADEALTIARDLLPTNTGDDDFSGDPDALLAELPPLDEVSLRINEALANWSDVRLEEQVSDLGVVIATACRVLLRVDAGMMTDLAKASLHTHCPQLCTTSLVALQAGMAR
jgi:hypothetical protein